MTIERKVELIGKEIEGQIKIVQIYLDDQPYLIYGHRSNSWHESLLKHFLIEKIGDYPTIPHPHYERDVMPALEGERYKVVGMGIAIIDSSEKKLIIYKDDESFDYKIKPNKEFNELIKKSLEGWKVV